MQRLLDINTRSFESSWSVSRFGYCPRGSSKGDYSERVDLNSLNEKLDTVMIRWDQLIDMGRGGMRSAVGSIVFNQWLGMANFCTFE